jgi:aldehyde dehydrogenase (NAD+)
MSTQTTIDSSELFIGGEWVEPQGSERISVVAASTEELVGSVPEGTNTDIDAAVNAEPQWRGRDPGVGCGRGRRS